MDIMTILKIILVVLLAVPVFALSLNLTGKLMDELIEKSRRNK